MDRRTFLTGAGAVLLVAPLAAEAQQAAKVYRIGFLQAAVPSDPVFQRLFEAFRAALAELGYVEGKTSPSRSDGQLASTNVSLASLLS